jgi:hypothetical protein
MKPLNKTIRAQLKVLDAVAANLEYLLSASTTGGRTTIAAKPPSRTTLQNQEPSVKLEEGRADLFKRAG